VIFFDPASANAAAAAAAQAAIDAQLDQYAEDSLVLVGVVLFIWYIQRSVSFLREP
jgi:hypothetical protein